MILGPGSVHLLGDVTEQVVSAPSPCSSSLFSGGIASRAAPEATPRPPSGHLVANR
jgi:hypothetical protein